MSERLYSFAQDEQLIGSHVIEDVQRAVGTHDACLLSPWFIAVARVSRAIDKTAQKNQVS